jgi:glutamine amidotransferase
MCRFVLYLGDEILLSSLITEPENSLVHQSFESRERTEPLNGDGFGVAWYVPTVGPDAALFRAITPAWSNQNLAHLARMTRSGCVFAHVRAASTGMAVTETNTHPFVHGEFAFMHNGEIGAFSDVRRALLDSLGSPAYRMIEGTTDSEHLFALVLDQLARTPEASLGNALELAIGRLLELCDAAGARQPSYLNVAVSNGREAAVSRFTTARDGAAPSLHLHTGKLYACHERTPRLLDPGTGRHAVIVASETLTDDATWRVVPNNHLVEIAADRSVALRPFAPRR